MPRTVLESFYYEMFREIYFLDSKLKNNIIVYYSFSHYFWFGPVLVGRNVVVK